ncbi:MAG: hypothetical protein RL885_09935 [Planctomycetota bacterium]
MHTPIELDVLGTDCDEWIATETVSGSNPGDLEDDPAEDCTFGQQDSYTHVYAKGVEVWGYTWSKDNCLGGGHADSAKATASNGTEIRVFIDPEDVEASCTASISGKTKPYLKLRYEVYSNNSIVNAAGRMILNADELDIDQEINSGIHKKPTEEDETTIPTPWGDISWTSYWNESDKEMALTPAQKSDSQALTEERIVFTGSVYVDSFADGAPLSTAECEGFVFCSFAGAELTGTCSSPCGGGVRIRYGWYNGAPSCGN